MIDFYQILIAVAFFSSPIKLWIKSIKEEVKNK